MINNDSMGLGTTTKTTKTTTKQGVGVEKRNERNCLEFASTVTNLWVVD
jgi:hypothetical protein